MTITFLCCVATALLCYRVARPRLDDTSELGTLAYRHTMTARSGILVVVVGLLLCALVAFAADTPNRPLPDQSPYCIDAYTPPHCIPYDEDRYPQLRHP